MILLNKDGTYKISKKSNKLSKKDNVEYVMFDNSTALRKDVFSIVKYNKIDFDMSTVYLDYDLQFCDVDMVFTDYTRIKSHLKISKLDQRYNIYPLICQLRTFNSFGYDFLDVLFNLYLEYVDLRLDELIYSFDCDTSDEEVINLFNKLKLMTHMNKIFKYNEVIIFKDNKWEKIMKEDISHSFDYIGLPIEGCENILLLSKKDYKLLNKIKGIKISVDFYDDICNIEEDDIDFSCYANFLSFKQYLQLFIFLPQFIELCKIMYQRKIIINMHIIINGKETECTIPWNYIENGICIYTTIMKVLYRI